MRISARRIIISRPHSPSSVLTTFRHDRIPPRRLPYSTLSPSDLPDSGTSFPDPKTFPSVRYPTTNPNLRHPDASPYGLFTEPKSSRGASLALDSAVKALKLTGPYPVINWQHWVENTSARSKSGEGDVLNVQRRSPSLTKYPVVLKLVMFPKHLLDVFWYFIASRRLRDSVDQRISIPPGGFKELVSSVIASELDTWPSTTVAATLDDMRKEYNATTGSTPTKTKTEQIEVYVPDPSELTRAEFHALRRTGSFTAWVLSLVGMNAVFARFCMPSLAPSVELSKSAEDGIIKAWEASILSARKTYLSAHGTPDLSASTIDTFKKAIPTCTQDELVKIAKAVGMLPSWMPAALVVRAPLMEALLAHMAFLRADNVLIGRWGGVWKMDEREVNWALLQRGCITSGLTLEQKRAQLYMLITALLDLRHDALFLISPTSLSTAELDRICRLREKLCIDTKKLGY
ncbi:hypothetical protein BZA70DRAFT_276403 [Myxozyma melibiosi]|uniref:Letm1 RBD domain-containing protein n=1 Tax=Myxozyma melibiosi TaxID=54550 RepID=A0ABR1F938_9ASCO